MLSQKPLTFAIFTRDVSLLHSKGLRLTLMILLKSWKAAFKRFIDQLGRRGQLIASTLGGRVRPLFLSTRPQRTG